MLLDWLQRTCAHPNQMQNTENNNDCDTSIFPLLKAEQSSCISILTDESTEISVTRMLVVYTRGVFKTRNGEMTKWRNDEIAKWRNGTKDKSHSYKV